jgi:flavin reductase (DIM6/NTAB) family NADH-FMN oxidoreductase RutF
MTRIAVPLEKSYRLHNHGPTVLVSAAHDGRVNVMAAAWNMPLDFTPPKVAVVIDRNTYTRGLIEASGEFTLSVPCLAQLALTSAAGDCSGRDVDKEATIAGLSYTPASMVTAPLVDGCVAWMECRVLREPHIEQTYDLFLGVVVAAWANDRVFRDGRWHFEGHDELRTLHHVAGGNYFLPGASVTG